MDELGYQFSGYWQESHKIAYAVNNTQPICMDLATSSHQALGIFLPDVTAISLLVLYNQYSS